MLRARTTVGTFLLNSNKQRMSKFDQDTYNRQKRFFVNLTLTSVCVLFFLSVIWYWFSGVFSEIPMIFSAYSVAVLLILFAEKYLRLKLNWGFILWALVSVVGNFMIVLYSGGIHSQFTFVFVIVCYGGYMASLRYGKIMSYFLLLLILLIYTLNLTNLIPQTTIPPGFLVHFNFLAMLFVLSLFMGMGIISAQSSYRLVKAKEEIIRQKEEIEKQKNEVEKEKERSEGLLLNILPEEVANELKARGSADAKLIDNATVLFTDFKGFTGISELLTPRELVAELNHCFSAFDDIMQKHGIEKIKTIGDAYMAAGGLPVPTEASVKNTVLAALEMQNFISKRKAAHDASGKPAFEMRVGIHTGPVVAGIVGVKKFQYDIWGDAVNTASRIESSGEVGKVNISQSTYELLKDAPEFTFKSRGKIVAKGKGGMEMYFVEHFA